MFLTNAFNTQGFPNNALLHIAICCILRQNKSVIRHLLQKPDPETTMAVDKVLEERFF